MITGIILAGGESSRMKSPKALLKIGEVTFAEHIARLMRQGGVDPVYLVTGAHHEEIERRFGVREAFTIVRNLRYSHGQVSSLKEGVRNLPTGAQAVMVWPVDLPLVKGETVADLVQAFKKEGKAVTIPQTQGKHGHPVIYGLAAIQTILGLRRGHTAKDIRSKHAGDVTFVDVNDPGILSDIDTPEDYEREVGS